MRFWLGYGNSWAAAAASWAAMRSLHTSAISQPAPIAALTRALTSPAAFAPAMDRSSENKTPLNWSWSRMMSFSQILENPAGLSSTCEKITWAGISASSHGSVCAKGCISLLIISSNPRVSMASDTWESGAIAPWPGKCLPVVAMPAAFIPRINWVANAVMAGSSWWKLRSPITWLIPSLSSTGAKLKSIPTDNTSAAIR